MSLIELVEKYKNLIYIIESESIYIFIPLPKQLSEK